MAELLRDLRYALRMARGRPSFTIVAVLTLGLGIGANTAIFSFINAVLLRPLPYPDADRIVFVWEKPPRGERNPVSTLNFLDWKSQNTVFTAMSAQAGGTATLTGVAIPVQFHATRVSPSYFDILGMRPMLGRTFAPDEDQLGKEYVVVLSNRIWKSQFGSEHNIIGQSISLDNHPYTVVGVLPSVAALDNRTTDIWLPLAFEAKDMTRGFHWMISMAKLKPNVSLESALAQMKSVAAHIEQDYPDSNKDWSVTIDRYQDRLVDKDLRRSLLMLLAAVVVILLIGCVNLANLLLARGVAREYEISVRSALGASRGRLVRQFLTESGVLALLGAVAGVSIGFGSVVLLKASLPRYFLPPEADVRIDGSVLAFTAGVAIVTAILFGLIPAFQATRMGVTHSLKDGGRGATSGSNRRRLQNVLVVAEVALAFVLLAGAGLLIRSFAKLQQVDAGFESTNVLTMALPMSRESYQNGSQIASYLGQILEKIQSVAGVREAAITSALPLQGGGYGMPFRIEGKPLVDRSKRAGCFYKIVSPLYFSALRMRILKGRALTETDTEGSIPVTVVDDSMVKQYFKDQDPIGSRILIQQVVPGKRELGAEIPWLVVGIVADEKVSGLDRSSSAGVYVSYKQSPVMGVSLVVRASMDPDRLLKSIQSGVTQINKDQALPEIKTLDQIKSESLGNVRLRTVVLGVFAGMALLLAAIGIYGVLSYSVAQRTHEIGVRAALGATYWDQTKLVLGGAMLLTLIGLAIGIASSLLATRLLVSLLFNIAPNDSVTMIVVGFILIMVVLAACYIPARRAMRVDPIIALRYE